MTATFELGLQKVKMNKHLKYWRWFRSKFIARTHKHTHTGSTALYGPPKWSVLGSKLSHSHAV